MNAVSRQSKAPDLGISDRGFTMRHDSDSLNQDTVAASIIKPCHQQAQPAPPQMSAPDPAIRIWGRNVPAGQRSIIPGAEVGTFIPVQKESLVGDFGDRPKRRTEYPQACDLIGERPPEPSGAVK